MTEVTAVPGTGDVLGPSTELFQSRFEEEEDGWDSGESGDKWEEDEEEEWEEEEEDDWDDDDDDEWEDDEDEWEEGDDDGDEDF